MNYNRRKQLKFLYLKYKHGIPAILYGIVYLTWFTYLERSVTSGYRVIHVSLDDHIPFCEFFVIPYFLWFLYVTLVLLYCFFHNKEDYKKNCIFLFTGMTIFLIISTLWPNGHHLRPEIMPRDNFFTYLVSKLYLTDTATNLWPSIHVYNSLGAHFAVMHSKKLSSNKWILHGSGLLATSIILSTMLIKQHSVFDVTTAFFMSAVMYLLVYKFDISFIFRSHREKEKTRAQAG